jgi:hypothetical protein
VGAVSENRLGELREKIQAAEDKLGRSLSGEERNSIIEDWGIACGHLILWSRMERQAAMNATRRYQLMADGVYPVPENAQ